MAHVEDDDQEIDDRDMPNESDMDPADDDGTDPCPHCGKAIYEDSEWCPHCGKYISDEEAPVGTPTWAFITAIGLLLLFGLGYLVWR